MAANSEKLRRIASEIDDNFFRFEMAYLTGRELLETKKVSGGIFLARFFTFFCKDATSHLIDDPKSWPCAQFRIAVL